MIPNPDTSAVEAAIVNRLASDPAFVALVPDGVYVDEAPPNAQRFAIVSRVPGAGEDVATFGGRALETALFLIKAVMLSTAHGDMQAAALRIDQLFEDAPLPVEGYTWATTYRTEPIRATEKDDLDPAMRWYHRGGWYRVNLAIG